MATKSKWGKERNRKWFSSSCNRQRQRKPACSEMDNRQSCFSWPNHFSYSCPLQIPFFFRSQSSSQIHGILSSLKFDFFFFAFVVADLEEGTPQQRQQSEKIAKDLFVSFHCYCSRKEVPLLKVLTLNNLSRNSNRFCLSR